VIEVRDDGQGLLAEAVEQARERGRMGLTGMQERALVAGARLSFEGLPGSGTVVHVEVVL
jgi:signal transduction histidine kinase